MNKLFRVARTDIGYAVLWDDFERLLYFRKAFDLAMGVNLKKKPYLECQVKVLVSQFGSNTVIELNDEMLSPPNVVCDVLATLVTHVDAIRGILCENQKDAEYIYNEISKIYMMDLLKQPNEVPAH